MKYPAACPQTLAVQQEQAARLAVKRLCQAYITLKESMPFPPASRSRHSAVSLKNKPPKMILLGILTWCKELPLLFHMEKHKGNKHHAQLQEESTRADASKVFSPHYARVRATCASWIPAYAGMTFCPCRESPYNPNVIPAKAESGVVYP